MTMYCQVNPGFESFQLPGLENDVPHNIVEQIVTTTPNSLDCKRKVLPSLCLNSVEDVKVSDQDDNLSQECQSDVSKQLKGVGINVRYKGGRIINKTESVVWTKLKQETKADIEKVLREEFDRFQQVDDTPSVGGSFQHLVEIIENARLSYQSDELNRTDVKEMRKLVPQLRKLCYLEPSEIENKGKVKNIWSKKPEDWPLNVAHVDPNNPGTDTLTRKKNPKPNKQQLTEMFVWLAAKYERRRDELTALLMHPHGGANEKWFDDDDQGEMFTNIVNGFNDPNVSDACCKVYAKLWREEANGLEQMFAQIELQHHVTALLQQTLICFEKNVPVGMPDFVDKLNKLYDTYQQRCFQPDKSAAPQIPSTLTLDVPCSPETPNTFGSQMAPTFYITQDKSAEINTSLNLSAPTKAVSMPGFEQISLEDIQPSALMNDESLAECCDLINKSFPNNLIDGFLDLSMDLDIGDQEPLKANPMLSEAGSPNGYEQANMIPSFVSAEVVSMEM